MNTKVYEWVTARVIAALEKGTAPWRKPWAAGGMEANAPTNLATRKPYRGVNIWLLHAAGYSSPYWVTAKQAKALGGAVKPEAFGDVAAANIVVYFQWQEKVDAITGRKRKVPFFRYSKVYNAAAQCTGLEKHLPAPPPADPAKPAIDPIAAAEAIASAMPSAPPVTYGGNRACYSPSLDVVRMPERHTFTAAPEFYSTLFHELTHATGHESRVGREFGASFGSDKYSREELVAEMGAAFLCAEAGIVDATLDNSAAYLASWISRLKADPTLIVKAASAAQKAAEYILGKAAPAPVTTPTDEDGTDDDSAE